MIFTYFVFLVYSDAAILCLKNHAIEKENRFSRKINRNVGIFGFLILFYELSIVFVRSFDNKRNNELIYLWKIVLLKTTKISVRYYVFKKERSKT